MNRTIKTRIEALQMQSGKQSNDFEVLKLIKQGLFYDDLTESQKDAYFLYRYGMESSERPDLEEFFYLVLGSLHFQLEQNDTRPLQDKIEEVQAYLESIEPLTPEQNEKESREYEEREKEIERIKELRNKAKINGESVEKYPYPWQIKQNKGT